MAVGKNKRLSKGGKRSTKRKIGDSMLNKEWYDVVAPSSFNTRHCTKTIATKSKGTYIAADNLKGRVFEVNLADLMTNNDQSTADDQTYKCRKIQLKAEEVQGRNILTNFNGMSLTTDKLRSMLNKWCTLIEGSVEVKTSDGYTLRVFAIAFTKKIPGQVRKNCHCQSSHVKKIRGKMAEIITAAVNKNSLDKVVKKIQQDVMGDDIRKACVGIFPLQNVHIRKVKVTKCPKFDAGRLMEIHGGQNAIPKSLEGGRQLQTTTTEDAADE